MDDEQCHHLLQAHRQGLQGKLSCFNPTRKRYAVGHNIPTWVLNKVLNEYTVACINNQFNSLWEDVREIKINCDKLSHIDLVKAFEKSSISTIC